MGEHQAGERKLGNAVFLQKTCRECLSVSTLTRGLRVLHQGNLDIQLEVQPVLWAKSGQFVSKDRKRQTFEVIFNATFISCYALVFSDNHCKNYSTDLIKIANHAHQILK